MASCVPILLEINISYCDAASKRKTFVFNDELIDIAEELFVAHLIRLPRIIYTGDEDEQLANMQQLKGFIVMLCNTNRLKITLSNESILESFVTVLLAFVELDRSVKLLDANNNIYDINDMKQENTNSIVMLRNNTPWKDYKNLRDSKTVSIVREICHCLSNSQSVNVFILEYLMKLLTNNSIHCNEALVIIQLFCENAFNKRNRADETLHNAILEEVLCDYRWHLSTEATEQMNKHCDNENRQWYEDRVEGLYESQITICVSDVKNADNKSDRLETITIKDIQNNILHMCLITETIGLYAKQMHEQYQKYLLNSLHRLMEKSASIHYMIRTSAIISLNNVKSAFGFESISALIFNNADYITYSINMSLKKPDQIDVALRILGVVLYYSSVESLPHLENIIATIIMESSKLNQYTNILSFIQAFTLILSTIRKSFGKEANEKMASISMNEVTEENNRNYIDIWMDMLKTNDAIEDENDCDQNEEIDENAIEKQEQELEAEEQTKTNPPLVDLSINIIKQCIPYFASKNQRIKLAALECLTIGLDIIKNYENELLPIVHQLWDSFVQQCIQDKSSVVLRYCIQLYVKLALYAKDFIFKRSTSEILPYINNYLRMLSQRSISDKQRFLYE